ncbi:YozQ family protein [Anaerobacillus sp. MEB173]|uniref:YozQ family protein n=1 Tax=Anaerobacillus sp. MEB173 TaxID=3383345 RepID=UPI003F8F4330
MAKEKQGKVNNSTDVAEHAFHPSDYESSLEVEQGLATTHEQVSDTLMEGTIDAKIERENGKAEEIPRKGYE